MKIEWIGHSCFLIQGDHPALRVLIDPYTAGAYDGAIGYRPVREEADLVVVTHKHPDHEGTALLTGNPLIVRGDCTARSVQFETIDLSHDLEGGKQRGTVKAFRFEMDGMCLAHLSDVGNRPDDETLRQLEGVQILMIPVGGRYTIDGRTAKEICNRIRPAVVLPMHYKTEKVAMDLEPVDDFLEGQEKVRRIPQSVLRVTANELPEPITCVVLSSSH